MPIAAPHVCAIGTVPPPATAVMLKLRVTFVAGAIIDVPACDAVIVHVPTARMLIVSPVTEQIDGVFEVSVGVSDVPLVASDDAPDATVAVSRL